MKENIKPHLVRYARSLGFEGIAITSAAPLPRDENFLKKWLAAGHEGEMAYLRREPARRARPAELLPGAKSVIALVMAYQGGDSAPSSEGRIARYARGRDYHKVLGKKVESFVRYIKAMAPGTECRTFVDTGPLLERAVAQRAGLGFIGKNTMLITRSLGSWVFLASVVTTMDLPADAPDEHNCGKCRLCIDACPTGAITAPYSLDPRRCIAYLTIESKKPIPEDLRSRMGGWIFGCDVCQEVCPHNFRKMLPSSQPSPRIEGRESKGEGWLALSEVLAIRDNQVFCQRFAGSALMRAGRAGLLRNACVAAANLDREDLIPHLQKIARNDLNPTVQEHAAWALETLSAGRVSRVH
jgi:epoxyqueuosine reductase